MLNDKEIHLMDYFKRIIISKDDLEDFINQYYLERGWNAGNGFPTMEKIVELKLADLNI